MSARTGDVIEEVWDAWIAGTFYDIDPDPDADAFDRWLARHDAKIAERIAQAIERRKRDMAEGYAGTARAMLEVGMDAAARIAREEKGKQ